VLNPVQSGPNAELGRVLGSPFGVVIVSLCISLAFALLANLLSRGGDAFDFGRLGQARWWAWVGGFCGAIFLVS